jgi:thioredoxin-like negative regulator of GroEL
VLSAAEVENLLKAAAGHYDAGALDAAAAIYERIERANPRDIRAVYSLAMVEIRRRRPAGARTRLRRVIAREPGHFAAQHNLGAACQELGRWREAAGAYRCALDVRPDAAETHFRLAVALAVLGRTDEAIACYRALADHRPSRLRALTRLAVLDADALSDPELADLRSAAFDPATDAQARIGALFAAAEGLESRGADDDAFAAFAAGNRLKRDSLVEHSASGRSLHPDAILANHAKAVALVRRTVTAAFIAEHRGAGNASAAPIFIVGMPRSGSSLIEQILASHPMVRGLGETGALSRALDARSAYAQGAPIRPGQLRGAGDDYLAAMRARGWKGAARFVDKTLENYLHVGMIHLLFPSAIILHSVRDPVDACLSCYRQLFAGGDETLYDLSDIGAEYVAYRAMMDHWARLLPGRVIEVSHEALVAAPQERIRWLVTRACGLAWDPACLRFHEAAGVVTTASAAQVRRPIFTSSLQRWRRYEKHLGPLFEALGPYVPKSLPPLHGEGGPRSGPGGEV